MCFNPHPYVRGDVSVLTVLPSPMSSFNPHPYVRGDASHAITRASIAEFQSTPLREG